MYFPMLWAGIFLLISLNLKVNGQGGGAVLRLYKDTEFRGRSLAIFALSPEEASKNGKSGCVQVPPNWTTEISGISLDRNCVEIFKGDYCSGESQILDGQSNSAMARLSSNLFAIGFNDQVHSLKLCEKKKRIGILH